MKIKLGNISKMVMHFVGNKHREEGISFSEKELDFTEVSSEFVTMLSNSFDYKESCHFYFESTLDLNPIYTFVKTIFADTSRFLEQSVFIAKILYEKSSHPMTKAGELNVIYLTDCEIDGNTTDAIALLKTEEKQKALQYQRTESGYEIKMSEVITLSKVEKGCIIFNMNQSEGYHVFSVDKKSQGVQSRYWKDDFLHIEPDNTSYHQTKNLLQSCKTFIEENFKQDSKIEKASLVSKIKGKLEKAEHINTEDFSKEMFGDSNMDKEFQTYLSSEANRYAIIQTDVTIDNKQVKRKSSMPKTTLYLDSNFEITILGGEENIVQGFDEDAGMEYYKFYYVKEK